MARLQDKEKAIILRKQEMSYSEIKSILGINKSTLSGWLKNYPLSKERIDALRGKNEKRIERYREARRKTKERRLDMFYLEEKRNIFPLTNRDFFIAGLFLYWGEGSKTMSKTVCVSNTDPSMVRFFIDWTKRCLKVPKEKIHILLHLYSDMEIDKEITFWSKALNIPKTQFNKPYIKQSSVRSISYKGMFGHGTCNARIHNARLSEKILMALKVVSDQYTNTGP